MKKAGVIAAVSLFVIVIILVAVYNGATKKKEGGTVTVSPSSSQSTSTTTKGFDVGMYNIVDTSLLDYTQPIIETSGTVHSKQCLLDGTQVVYLITIVLDELNSSTVKYYCSYQVYNSVEEGTRLSVSYQKLTESTFSVYSVTTK